MYFTFSKRNFNVDRDRIKHFEDLQKQVELHGWKPKQSPVDLRITSEEIDSDEEFEEESDENDVSFTPISIDVNLNLTLTFHDNF